MHPAVRSILPSARISWITVGFGDPVRALVAASLQSAGRPRDRALRYVLGGCVERSTSSVYKYRVATITRCTR